MKRLISTGALMAITLLGFSATRAQQPKDSQAGGPAAPVQPLSPLTDAGTSNTTVSRIGAPSGASGPAQPDMHLLSSAENLGLGSLRGFRRTFDPALRISELDETGLAPGKSTLVSSLGGSLDMNEHWGAYPLTASYTGSDVYYQPRYEGMHYVPYHSLSISPEILSGRWTLRFRDTALYSWGAGFTSLFAGGPTQFAQSSILNAIQPSLAPSGTIETALARQLNNTALAEADYAFSRRTTLSLVASYGFLHFLDPGYINSQYIHGRVGYNYSLSAANSISFSYDYNRTAFGGASNRLQTNQVQMSFGRKITGRLAFQLAAGPELLRLENFGSSNSNQLSWSASSALTYNLRHSGYSLSYSHGVTPGSGVFLGSKTDALTGTASRELARFWSASINGGYARHKSLPPTR